MNKLEERKTIYRGTFNKAGLEIELVIIGTKNITSVYVRGSGVVTEKDPYIFFLSSEYKPAVTHRLYGYEINMIIYTDGSIRLGVGEGSVFNQSFQIGYSFLNA